ncbi:MAG: GldG family protein [Mariprofundaceae bacterium]
MTRRSGDRRFALRRRAWLSLALVLLGVVVAVAAARVAHVRFDWTADKVYTLSDATKRVLAGLDEPLMIRAYITPNLPQPYGRLTRFIEDMLAAYHDAGGGNVGYEVIDPADDPNVESSLLAQNVPKIRVQVVENDQAQVRQGWLAIVLEYLDRKEVIPVVSGEEGFEYLLTRKIKKLTGKGRTKVAVAAGFGAHDLARLGRLRELAGDDYEFVSVRLADEPVPADAKVLIVAGVSRKPSALFRYRIDQFRMRGGGMLAMASNVVPLLAQGFVAQAVDRYANDWLRGDLGVAVDAGLVLDRRASRILVNQRQGMFLVRTAVDYPFVPEVADFDRAHPVTAGLERITMPFPAPLVATERLQDARVLARTSPMAAVQSGPGFDIDPLRPMRERFTGVQPRQSDLIVAWEGAPASAFPTAPEGVDETERNGHKARGSHARLLVTGSADMLDDDFLDGGNLIFALNALDWLAGDEQLIALRSRGVTDRPLMPLEAGARQAWKVLWMFGLPGLVALAGLMHWWRLRRRGPA